MNIVRAILVLLLSVAVSLVLMLFAIPVFGGTFSPVDLMLCLICPVAVALPPGIIGAMHRDRLVRQLRAGSDRQAELAAACEALKERARRDEMTGMLHRDAFLRTINNLIHEPGGALLLVDADDFRLINERFGHRCGDDVLLQISDALHRAAGRCDILGRLSGEEFAIFVPDARRGRASALAERICEEVQRAQLIACDAQDVQISVSVGVAMSGGGAAMDALLLTAEQSLRNARHLGRARVGIDDGMIRTA